MEKIFDTIEDYRNSVSVMKNYYKKLSANIREEKVKFKDLVREDQWPEYVDVWYRLEGARRKARVFNVVYSILKGKSYKQIEPKIREKNELYGGEITIFCEKWNLPSDPFVKEVKGA
mgnify:CR=1 FL=1